MISQPGAAMLDSKLFVSRFDDPFPDLYERFWNGVEWVWVNHGRPEGIKMAGAPGAAMLDKKLFVVVDDGSLWERNWQTDTLSWAWQSHGRPANKKIVYGPDAAMLNEKLFMVTEDGDLWQRNWQNDTASWAWQDHGRPNNKKIVTAPGAAMMGTKLFVATEDGDLWELNWRDDLVQWVWFDHGRPGNEKIICAPGAAMLDEKFFVTTENGNVWERQWRSDLNRWAWQPHGKPNGTNINTAPGAAMSDQRFFVGASDGHAYELGWNGPANQWLWTDHGAPPGTSVATAPGAAMLNQKFFVGTSNSHLFEHVWTGTEWKWEDHGRAYHDQSETIIDAGGNDPKMIIAVMGDGFAEGDMNEYKKLVNDQVLAAFNLDALGQHHDKIRMIRIDVVSPVSGVTTRDYDEAGTTGTSVDDKLLSENFRYSRLGIIFTGIWSHCWFEEFSYRMPRITSIQKQFAPDATHVIVMVNNSDYGGCSGGAIAEFTKGSGKYVIAHEMGHQLFGLGDEYHEDEQAFTAVQFVANLSETPTSWDKLKWKGLVADTTALPTLENMLPGGWNKQTDVGAFEGGGANFSTGVFRPVLECRMNQNDPPWCPVCANQINKVFDAI